MPNGSGPEMEALGLFANLAIILIAMGISLVISAIICYFLFDLFNALPEGSRQLQPGLVWLLLIPCFNLVWNFFVYPKLSASYEAFFRSKGVTEVGNANSTLAWTFCILCAVSIIPCVGYITGLAALVVLIIYLVKMYELKHRLMAGGWESHGQ